MTIASYRQETLARDLRNLRVEAGNIIFIHSSFRSLGSVIGGASAIIEAFKEVVGPEGLILMPSFHLVEITC